MKSPKLITVQCVLLAKTIVITSFMLLCLTSYGQTYIEKIWETNAYRHLSYFGLKTVGLAISPDSSTIASANDNNVAYEDYIFVWRVSDASWVNYIEQCEPEFLSLAFSMDGQYIASSMNTGDAEGKEIGALRIFDYKTKEWVSETVMDWNPKSITFSPDNEFLVAATKNVYFFFKVRDMVRGRWIFDLESYKHVCYWNAYQINWIMFAPMNETQTNYYLAFGDEIGKVGVLNCNSVKTTNYAPIVEMYDGHQGQVYSVAFSPDAKLIVSGGEDGKIIIRGFPGGQVLNVLDNNAPVEVVTFSPDGKLLVTCGTTIKFWKVSDWQLLFNYSDGKVPFSRVTVAPNGKFFAFGRYDATIGICNMPLWIEEVNREKNTVTIKWNGGSGLYRVQACSDLLENNWQNISAPTTNTVFTHTSTNTLFYRVISVPNSN